MEVRHINRSSSATHQSKDDTGTKIEFGFGSAWSTTSRTYCQRIARPRNTPEVWGGAEARFPGLRGNSLSSGFSDSCCAADPRASSLFTVPPRVPASVNRSSELRSHLPWFRGKRRTWMMLQHGKSQCQTRGGRYEAKDHLDENRRVLVMSALSDHKCVVNHQPDEHHVKHEWKRSGPFPRSSPEPGRH